MATVRDLRARVRELESENEALEQEVEDLRDTLGQITELASGEEGDSTEDDSDES